MTPNLAPDRLERMHWRMAQRRHFLHEPVFDGSSVAAAFAIFVLFLFLVQ